MLYPESWPDPNIEYLSRPEFTSKRIYHSIKRQCRIATYFDVLSVRAEWLGELYVNEIKNAHIADICIQHINDNIGHGVFANQHMPAGDFVGIYTGIVRRRSLFRKCPSDYSFAYPQIKFGLGRFSIDAKNKGNETRYINHSSHPNCEAVSAFHNGILHVIIRTTQKIPAGEQLLISYGGQYWRKRLHPIEIE